MRISSNQLKSFRDIVAGPGWKVFEKEIEICSAFYRYTTGAKMKNNYGIAFSLTTNFLQDTAHLLVHSNQITALVP